MRSKGWILITRYTFAILACLVLCHFAAPTSFAQSDEGTQDLEAAFEKKIEATSTKDLDAVVKLCESAMKKGLDDSASEQAKQLAASALYEHADQLSQRIFAGGDQDPRWRVYRTHALSRLKKAVKFRPDMGEAFLLIAKLNALPGGDVKDSREAVEKAVELAGDDREQLSSALFIRASLAEDDEARLADLNQAIKINPENMDAVRVRSAYYLRQNDPESALEDLNNWLDSDEQNSANYLIVAQQLMATGSKFDEKLQAEAIRILDKAIEIDPNNPLPHTMKARVNIIREDLDAALENVSQAIKLDAKDYGARLIRATIYSEQEKLDEALADVNAALEVQPYRVDGIQMRGMILSQQQKFAEAIDDIKLLANNDRENPFYQRQLAMLYNADDQPSRAIRIYDRILEADEDGSWEGKSAGKQLTAMARRAAALRGRGDAQLSIGGHEEAVKNYEEALKLYEQIRKLEEEEGVEELSVPDDGVLNNLAWVLATSPKDDVRDGERAIKLATDAAELTEFKQAHILSTLASGYAETGDFDNAIKWIEKAIEVNKAEGEKAVDKTRTDAQWESLHKEYDSYKKKEPWRELQNVEEEKKQKAAEANEDESDDGEDDDENRKEDSSNSKSDDKQDDEKSDGSKDEGKSDDDQKDDQ